MLKNIKAANKELTKKELFKDLLHRLYAGEKEIEKLSLSWNFGKLTENVSKKKGVNNDDLIGGGNSNN